MGKRVELARSGSVPVRPLLCRFLDAGITRDAALATVVGVRIEVPVMLSAVWIVNNSRGWY